MTPNVPPRRVSRTAALLSGMLVAIATTGTLVGLGMRSGEATRVFRLAGTNLLGAAGMLGRPGSAPVLAAVITGNLHHLLVAMFWGTLMSLVVLRVAGVMRITMAVLLPAVYALLLSRTLPPLLRIGHAVTSNLADLLPIAATMVVALLGGAWVASSSLPASRDVHRDVHRERYRDTHS